MHYYPSARRKLVYLIIANGTTIATRVPRRALSTPPPSLPARESSQAGSTQGFTGPISSCAHAYKLSVLIAAVFLTEINISL